MITFRAVSVLSLLFCVVACSRATGADEAESLVLRGRVIDTAGKPVSGLVLEIWSWSGEAVRAQHRVFDDGVEVRTDSDGRYQTPNVSDRELWYMERDCSRVR